MNTTRSTNDNMSSLFKIFNVLSNTCSTNASMNMHSHIFTDTLYNKSNLKRQFSCRSYNQSLNVIWGGINNLKSWNSESTCFTCSWLSLNYNLLVIKALKECYKHWENKPTASRFIYHFLKVKYLPKQLCHVPRWLVKYLFIK